MNATLEHGETSQATPTVVPEREVWDRLVDGAARGYKCSNGRHHESGLIVFKGMIDGGLFSGGTKRGGDGIAGRRVLDYGCGNGRISYHLADFHTEVTGVDVIEESVDFCRRHLPGEFLHLPVWNPHYNPAGAVAPLEMRLPFAAGSFDVVVAHSVFTHLGNLPAAAVLNLELGRVLRPGGRAWLTFFVSPPNGVSSDCARTVYSEESVLEVLLRSELWRVVWQGGGLTRAKHDQRCYVVEKLGTTESTERHGGGQGPKETQEGEN